MVEASPVDDFFEETLVESSGWKIWDKNEGKSKNEDDEVIYAKLVDGGCEICYRRDENEQARTFKEGQIYKAKDLSEAGMKHQPNGGRERVYEIGDIKLKAVKYSLLEDEWRIHSINAADYDPMPEIQALFREKLGRGPQRYLPAENL
jgi:hypothetical protein